MVQILSLLVKRLDLNDWSKMMKYFIMISNVIVLLLFANLVHSREVVYDLDVKEVKLIQDYKLMNRTGSNTPELIVYIDKNLFQQSDYKLNKKFLYILENYISKDDVKKLKNKLFEFIIKSLYYSLDNFSSEGPKDYSPLECRNKVMKILLKTSDLQSIMYIKSFIYPIEKWELKNGKKEHLQEKISSENVKIINQFRCDSLSMLLFTEYENKEKIYQELKNIIADMQKDELYENYVSQLKLREDGIWID